MNKAERIYDSLVLQVTKELIRLKPEMMTIVNDPKHTSLSIEEKVGVVISGRLRILADDAKSQVVDSMEASSMTDALLKEIGIKKQP